VRQLFRRSPPGALKPLPGPPGLRRDELLPFAAASRLVRDCSLKIS
jgi:hypothetical protein